MTRGATLAGGDLPAVAGPPPPPPAPRGRSPRGPLIAGFAAAALLLAITIPLAVANLPGSEAANQAATEVATVKLAYAGAMGSSYSDDGFVPYRGASLAVDEYNAKRPRVRIELVEHDTGASEVVSGAVAGRLVTGGFAGVIGPTFSNEANVVTPVLEQNQIPSVLPVATAPAASAIGPRYSHRILPDDDVQARSIAGLILRMGAKRVVVTDDEFPRHQAMARRVSAALRGSGIAVTTVRVPAFGYQFTTEADDVAAAKPDVIFTTGFLPSKMALIQQVKSRLAGARFMLATDYFDLTVTKDARLLEGVVMTCGCLDPRAAGQDPRLGSFRDRYRRAFGTDPGSLAPNGYDAATAFLEAVKAGKTKPADINAYLASLDLPGLAQRIRFGRGGEQAAGKVYAYTVTNGRFELLGDTTTGRLP